MKNIIFLFLILLLQNAFAQDTHYWSQHFGPRSALLGGAAIAGIRDNSGIFYNPGTLGFISNKNISVSATGYELDQVRIPDGGGTGIEIKSRTLQVLPLIISGIFKSDQFPRHTLGYCLLTKDQFNIRASARQEATMNVLSDINAPGPEDYVGQYTFKSSVYEMLSGWAYSYKISNTFSVGIGNYGAYRSLRADTYITARAIPIDSSNQLTVKVSTFDESKTIELKNIRTFFKLGLAADFDKLKLGLTLTSPSINVLGWATLSEDFTITNMDVLGIGVLFSGVGSDRQEGLPSQYKTPLSLAVGVEYKLKTTNVVFTAEAFDKVNSYNLVTPKDKQLIKPAGFVTVSSSDVLLIKEYKRRVFNFAIGFEQKLSEKILLAGSFRTNQSFTVRDSLSGVRISFTDWNINHIVLGITRKKEKSDISLGISYGFGETKNRNQWVNLTEPVERRFLTGDLKKTTVFYNALSLVIGYTFYLK